MLGGKCDNATMAIHVVIGCLQSAEQLAKSNEEERASLHNMLLLMVDEPLVIVVKLADRLHNMRTAYALAPNKRAAVATETLEVWCTLAERLGMFALKVSVIECKVDIRL